MPPYRTTLTYCNRCLTSGELCQRDQQNSQVCKRCSDANKLCSTEDLCDVHNAFYDKFWKTPNRHRYRGLFELLAYSTIACPDCHPKKEAKQLQDLNEDDRLRLQLKHFVGISIDEIKHAATIDTICINCLINCIHTPGGESATASVNIRPLANTGGPAAVELIPPPTIGQYIRDCYVCFPRASNLGALPAGRYIMSADESRVERRSGVCVQCKDTAQVCMQPVCDTHRQWARAAAIAVARGLDKPWVDANLPKLPACELVSMLREIGDAVKSCKICAEAICTVNTIQIITGGVRLLGFEFYLRQNVPSVYTGSLTLREWVASHALDSEILSAAVRFIDYDEFFYAT